MPVVDRGRRTVLRTLGAVAAASLAGCTEIIDGGTSDPTETPSGVRSNTSPGTAEETDTETDEPEDTETPSGPLINWVPARNQELIERIGQVRANKQLDEEETPTQQEIDDAGEEYWNDHKREDSVIFRDEENLPGTPQNREIDLAALEWWHDNDFENLSKDQPEMEVFVQSINGLTDEEAKQFSGYSNLQQKVETAKKEPKRSSYEDSVYKPENAKGASSVGDFLDQVHPFLFNLEWELDNGASSIEDNKFAAALQEATDRYTDVESTYWAFDLPKITEGGGGTHGNGLVYDHTNDELRVLETIVGAETSTPQNRQLHPLIEDSNYFEKGHDAFEMYWHPLRFDGTPASTEPLASFTKGKEYAASMFTNLATGGDIDEADGQKDVAPTTRYLTSVVDHIKNYNEQDNVHMNDIIDQAKAYQKLSNAEGVYAVGGTVESPVYAELDSQAEADEIWSDPDGTLDEYVEVEGLEDALEGHSASMSDVGAALNGNTAA